ncbi:MAG: hypothetical protein ACLUW6_00155 [Coriobacteriaceae bacterium]
MAPRRRIRAHEAPSYQPHAYQQAQPQFARRRRRTAMRATRPRCPAGRSATKADGQVAPYADMGRYKKKASVVSIIVSVVILAAIGGGVPVSEPLQFNVTVNGMTRTVDRGRP